MVFLRTNIIKFFLACAILTTSLHSKAGDAHVCYSQPKSVTPGDTLNDDTLFNCGKLGLKTIPQLASDGWKIIQANDVTISGGLGTVSWQLIIEK